MSDFIEWPSGTKKSFMEAYEGDGLVMERTHVARGTVQPQSTPTLTTGRGGGCGVVVMSDDAKENDRSEEIPTMNEGDVCPMLTPGREAKMQNGRRFKNPDEESFTVTTQDIRGVATVQNERLRIRYLTPRECLRLMGQSDEDIDKLMEVEPAKTVQYRLAGNSIVVDVLEAIFKGIYIDGTFRPKRRTLEDFL